MNKVVELVQPKSVEKPVNEQAVTFLTELLELAKKGDLTKFTMMYKKYDGSLMSVYTRTENLIEDLGMLARMTHIANERISQITIMKMDP